MKQKIIEAIKANKKSLLTGAICLAIILCILVIPADGKKNAPMNLSEYSSINTICELATLKSFYHNVVMYEVEPDGFDKVLNDVLVWPFGVYTKVGYKQYWLEYSGIVETGIDAGQIRISGPDANNVVEIYVPDAKVLSVYADENTLTQPISETGLFTSISSEEEAMAFAASQTEMRQGAENDQVMLRRARENAKLLLERYIVNTGKSVGLELTVKWIDNPV